MEQPSDERAELQARNRWPVVVPLIVAFLASLVIRFFDLDRKISELHYDSVRQLWPCERADPWLSFYRYGTYPPVILGAVGGAVFLFGRRLWPSLDERQLKLLRLNGLFLALMLIIGPGLVVNLGLKSLVGRPRPLQCQEFDGQMAFRHVGEIAAHKFPNSSFPSGHAAVAFFMMAPGFLVGSNRPLARAAWILGGIFYGIAMGFTRVLQGGHFVSDVLWAGVIVYLVGGGLANLLLSRESRYGLVVDSLKVQDSISVAPTS